MACVNPDGTLTASAVAMLRAMRAPSTAEQIAAATALPLFRVRSGIREIVENGLAVQESGVFRLTSEGERKVG
jgi:predicted transcriptional regulator